MTIEVKPSTADVLLAVARSAGTTARLLARRRLTMPSSLVGAQLRDVDGSCSTVFRETVAARRATDPVLFVVAFRLRWVGAARWAHAVFRRTCVVNTPLFAGFPGFVSKLWLADRSTDVYRGLYVWDGAARATAYAVRLSQVLRLVTVAGSVAYEVVEGAERAEFLSGRRTLPAAPPR